MNKLSFFIFLSAAFVANNVAAQISRDEFIKLARDKVKNNQKDALCDENSSSGGNKSSSRPFCADLQLVYFDTAKEDDAGSDDGGFGLNYALYIPIVEFDATADIDKGLVSNKHLDFTVSGNYAFDKNAPRQDFIKARLDGAYYRLSLSNDKIPEKCLAVPNAGLPECKIGESAVLTDLGLTGSYEMDQLGTNRAYTYGVTGTFVWHPAPENPLLNINFLDWPFRILRSATGMDDGFQSQPWSIPTLLLDIEQVNPEKDEARLAVLGDETEKYERLHAEVGFTTQMGIFRGHEVKFSASWRYFKELNAPTAIAEANLDTHRATFATVLVDNGWQVTYSTGRLPFDRKSDQIWQLGYNLIF